ncbi:hypothetical protein HMF7854_04855 [Sphingomonas ginkgonis]|uniref:Peptidase M10 metallopeptidase domain-containing protein n=1 Tax=Sphingomonas ginkgonis TaxID=2315330 RepID=A0A429V8E4_9SPHN|nr:hypothetical protein [Sphingomonas ginkgonis]RST30230.1 hypothetical protein HMF7854_04855 [Sphingomonas ginkgonis]
MKNWTRIAGLGTVAAALAVTPASANHSWGNYHWARTANPVQLRINAAVTSAWSSYVSAAQGQWDQSNVLALSSGAGSGFSAKRCDPVAGQLLVCNAAYGQRGWLGIASVWANGDHITQATTKLNDSYYGSGSTYNTPAWRAMVACQEIGHDFGLGHVNETFTDPNTGSCMDYTNDPTGTKGTNGTKANVAPNQHDYDQLATIYAHLDSVNTASSAPAATNFGLREVGKPAAAGRPEDPGVGDTMAEWGRGIHEDGKGRPDLFVKVLADGRQVITHVFWAPDAKGTEAQ